ncbi:hypothetical protein HQN87_20615 [Paenibacillus tritici]|uniref:DUF1461 domain-containing protein n=1 Tax=Paenibacillus tritici TaxID=1873425 RepID=A0ABX2DUC1_9BACL|nr:hypothetical protein [Paenibacillus tritici]NQX47732.1 hypothetical protein [Paenibacillus tritici]
MDRSTKLLFVIVLLAVLYIPACLFSYLFFFKVINYVDTGIYYRYATKDKFAEDIYFSEKVDAQTKVLSTLKTILDLQNKEVPSNKQQLFSELLSDEDLLNKELVKNEAFMSYLKNKHLDISNVIFYMKQLSNLDSTILSGSFYFVALIFIFTLYIKFKFRIGLYWIAGGVYVFSNLTLFTSGLFGNLFYPFMSWFGNMINQEVVYDDYSKTMNIFLPTIKEAFLSYIIFDTIGQYYQDRKNKIESKKIRNIYYSVNLALVGLRKRNNSALKVSKLQIDFIGLWKYCKRNKKDPELKEIKNIIKVNLSEFLNKKNSLKLAEAIKILEEVNSRLVRSKSVKEYIDDTRPQQNH